MDQPGYADFRARREATIWQRLNRILFVLLFLAVWLGIISLFVPPYKKMQAARAEIDAQQAQRDEQKLLLARAMREVSWLKADPTYLVSIAGEERRTLPLAQNICNEHTPWCLTARD